MSTSRMEAFSDGVLAILITIMVLSLKVPQGARLADLAPTLPGLLDYVLSFTFLGIYWNNHHHLLKAAPTINGAILWANLHLLFWLSLIPFSTSYMRENELAPLPTAVYGLVLLAAGLAYYILVRVILTHQGPGGPLAAAIGSDIKGKVSPLLYALAIAVAWWLPWLSMALYITVALVWLIPDRRIESKING